jgi:hypothetical protein
MRQEEEIKERYNQGHQQIQVSVHPSRRIPLVGAGLKLVRLE